MGIHLYLDHIFNTLNSILAIALKYDSLKHLDVDVKWLGAHVRILQEGGETQAYSTSSNG